MLKSWILCGVIFLSGIIILFIRNLVICKRKSEKISIGKLFNDSTVTYILGVITAIIGVTLALVVTNLDNQTQQREKTKEMILVAYKEVDLLGEELKELYLDVYKEDKQEFHINTSDNLVESPIVLEYLFNNQMTAFQMSSTSYFAILDLTRSIKLAYSLYNTSTTDYEKYICIENLVSDLEALEQVLTNEYLFMSREISKEELIEKTNNFYKDNSN